MNRPGDWSCRSCQHLNFQRRDSCRRCGDPKRSSRLGGEIGDFYGIGLDMGGRGGSSFGFGLSNNGVISTGPDVRPGDWYCAIVNCGAHNFASRSTCFKCGVFKSSEESFERSGFGSFSSGGGGGGGGSAGRSGWKSGDWICSRSGCNEHNFASRMECFRCNAPRDTFNNSLF